MLIKRNVIANIISTFDFIFEDSNLNHSCTCKSGDKVRIKFNDGNQIVEVIGMIKSIGVNLPIEKSKELTLVIDASEPFNSKIYTIKSSDVYDLYLVVENEDEDDPEPEIPPTTSDPEDEEDTGSEIPPTPSDPREDNEDTGSEIPE